MNTLPSNVCDEHIGTIRLGCAECYIDELRAKLAAARKSFERELDDADHGYATKPRRLRNAIAALD